MPLPLTWPTSMNQFGLNMATPPAAGVRPVASTVRPATTAACAALVMTGKAAKSTISCFFVGPIFFFLKFFLPSSLCHIISSFRSDTVVYRGTEERSFHGSMPRLNHPLSTHSSLHQIDGHSRHNSQQDVSAPPTLITHGTTASHSQAARTEDTSAWEESIFTDLQKTPENAVDAFKKEERRSGPQQTHTHLLSVWRIPSLKMGNVPVSVVLAIFAISSSLISC